MKILRILYYIPPLAAALLLGWVAAIIADIGGEAEHRSRSVVLGILKKLER